MEKPVIIGGERPVIVGEKKPLISLCMIVKNEEAWLPGVLESARPHVDEIIVVDTGSSDRTVDIAKQFGAKVYDFEWIYDFAAARNFSFSKATGEWILWLDADDGIVSTKGRNLREIVNETASGVGGVMFPYLYAFDEVGNCVARHKKVRICRNDGTFSWKGRIHEDLIPIGSSDIRGTDEIEIHHRADEERSKASSERNVVIAEKEYEEKRNDPRVVFNLATTYLALGRYNDAIKKYLEYVPMSAWDEEIYVAWCRAGIAMQALGQFDEAMNIYLRALKIKPQYADAYRGLAVCSINKNRLEDAEEYYRMCLIKEVPKSAIVYNPFEYGVAPYYELAQVLLHLNRIEDAIEAVEEYCKLSGGKENGIELRELLLSAKRETDFRESYSAVAKYLDDKKDGDGLKHLIEAVPVEFKSDPIFGEIRGRYWPKENSNGREVAIFCGMAAEEWGPASLEKGVGGSEEAVIRLSRELAKRGWEVTVFNNCGGETIEDRLKTVPDGGFPYVAYKPFWLWNPKDKYDVFISWRNPSIFDMKINAPVKLLDLHDVPNQLDYPSKRLTEITKVMVKSTYHRKLLPVVPDRKIDVIGHGVDASEFAPEAEYVRDPLQVCYTSSYDRGLENLLAVWPEVVKAVPGATLKIAYGWNLFDTMRRDAESQKWKAKMLKMMNQKSITELGRLSHKEVARLMKQSGVFAYPCHFAEIFCIAAAKAQAAGCVSIVGTSASCLSETVKIGIHVSGDMKSEAGRDAFRDELIKVLKDGEKMKSISKQAVDVSKTFDWGTIAEEWIKRFAS